MADGPPVQTSPGVLRFLPAAAMVALVVGAAGSVTLTFHAGRHSRAPLAVVLVAVWVLSPFLGLAAANILAYRWSALTRASLHVVMVVVGLISVIVYAVRVYTVPDARAGIFVAVPLASWLLALVVVTMTAVVSRAMSRRGNGDAAA